MMLGGSLPAAARQIEIHPYAGGFFPQKFLDLLKVKSEGVYGVKAGVFLTDNTEAEGHLGYIRNLNFADAQTTKRGYIWEGSGSYHFGGSPRFYVTGGLGGVTAATGQGEDFFFDSNAGTRDTFLAVSYGGGMKALNLRGPLGVRIEGRGRTLPRYLGFRFNWFEATAGLTFSFNGGRSKRSQ